MTTTKSQEAQELLNVAHQLLTSIRNDRAALAALVSACEAGDTWVVELFGTVEQRTASIQKDIAYTRGRLEAIREDLTALGLTQADCRALWARMQASA